MYLKMLREVKFFTNQYEMKENFLQSIYPLYDTVHQELKRKENRYFIRNVIFYIHPSSLN